jgi:hypothetical protein
MWKWALLTGFLMGMRTWLEAEARMGTHEGSS